MKPQAAYAPLRSWAAALPEFGWLLPLIAESERLLASDEHGDLAGWRQALALLPEAGKRLDGGRPAPVLGLPAPRPLRTLVEEALRRLHPWRKGPLEVAGIRIDTEWRSDWKWDRVTPSVELAGHRVLDVGSGNGYYGWRMLAAGAECVVGLDPTLVYVMQWLACRHFAGEARSYVLPLGVEAVPPAIRCFDTVFSMGVLYHRKDPVEHLNQLASLARPGGQLVLETLVLDEPGDRELRPRGRYARMRNVWSIPTPGRLGRWLEAAGLANFELLDLTATTVEEQRSTSWMTFESLADCLDPDDATRTIEGCPAPVRATIHARVAA